MTLAERYNFIKANIGQLYRADLKVQAGEAAIGFMIAYVICTLLQ